MRPPGRVPIWRQGQASKPDPYFPYKSLPRSDVRPQVQAYCVASLGARVSPEQRRDKTWSPLWQFPWQWLGIPGMTMARVRDQGARRHKSCSPATWWCSEPDSRGHSRPRNQGSRVTRIVWESKDPALRICPIKCIPMIVQTSSLPDYVE